MSTVARVLTFSLEVGSFFLQFLDWWYSQREGGGEGGGLVGGQTIPKPPPTITGKNDKYRAYIKKQTFQVLVLVVLNKIIKNYFYPFSLTLFSVVTCPP